ncbi:Alpha-(1,3)-fucosyltransferase 7 [Sparganum proliferum]
MPMRRSTNRLTSGVPDGASSRRCRRRVPSDQPSNGVRSTLCTRHNAHREYGMVPIVYGASREEFYARAPPNSYIHVDDFKTVKDLASHLNYLDKNDTAYASYFAWKEHGEVLTWLRVDCRVCGVLHHVLSGRLKLFDSTYKTYLDETRTCTNTSQINF